MPTIYVPGGKFSAATKKITAIAWAVDNGIFDAGEVLFKYRTSEIIVHIGGDHTGVSGNTYLRLRYGATWKNNVLVDSETYHTTSTVQFFFPSIDNADGDTRLTVFDAAVENSAPDEVWWGKFDMQSGGDVYMKCTKGDSAGVVIYTGGNWGNVFFSSLPGP